MFEASGTGDGSPRRGRRQRVWRHQPQKCLRTFADGTASPCARIICFLNPNKGSVQATLASNNSIARSATRAIFQSNGTGEAERSPTLCISREVRDECQPIRICCPKRTEPYVTNVLYPVHQGHRWDEGLGWVGVWSRGPLIKN